MERRDRRHSIIKELNIKQNSILSKIYFKLKKMFRKKFKNNLICHFKVYSTGNTRGKRKIIPDKNLEIQEGIKITGKDKYIRDVS
jgi:hypothetical protein